jgi:chromosome partitioning protein
LIRLVIANQRGGVSKTTTTHTLARVFADLGMRVLVVDTDSQGSLGQVLGLKPTRFLHEFIINDLALESCVVSAHPNIDVLCSNRENNKAEMSLQATVFGELAFTRLFGRVEKQYSVVLIDVAPSINILQTCAMVYTKNVLIPVAMDMLSLQGAVACLETTRLLSSQLQAEVKVIGLLPAKVDQRYNLTRYTMDALEEISARYQVPLLPIIRTDATVPKVERMRKFLQDADPTSKALEDYQLVAQRIIEILHVDAELPVNSQTPAQT